MRFEQITHGCMAEWLKIKTRKNAREIVMTIKNRKKNFTFFVSV